MPVEKAVHFTRRLRLVRNIAIRLTDPSRLLRSLSDISRWTFSRQRRIIPHFSISSYSLLSMKVSPDGERGRS